MKKVVLQCGGVLLAASLLQFWLFFYSPWTFPARVDLTPNTPPLNLRGLLLFIVSALILRFFIRKYYRQYPEALLSELISIGFLATLISEIPFQLLRGFTYPESSSMDRVWEFLFGVLGMSLMMGAVSLAIAGRLKGNKATPWIATLLIVLFGLGFRYLQSSGLVSA